MIPLFSNDWPATQRAGWKMIRVRAEQVLENLPKSGIDLNEVGQRMEDVGLDKMIL